MRGRRCGTVTTRTILTVYIALRGSADVEIDGHRYPLDAEHVIRVGPTARRKILPGPEGVRLLAISGVPGLAYDPVSTA